MLFSLLFVACSLISQLSESLPQQTFAVVVGVSDYKLGLPNKGDLHYSGDDARNFCELLKSQAGGRVPPTNIRLLIDRHASRVNILQAMTIFQRARANDRIIFFFSGHGDEGLFLPYDAYMSGPDLVLQHAVVKAAFRKSAAHIKFLIADACKSGSMTKRLYPHALNNHDSVSANDTTNIAQANANSSVVVILSSSSNEVSQESSRLKGGAFTHYLVEGARGAADNDPHDGIVTIKELHRYIWRKVKAEVGDGQTPKVFGRFSDTLAFASLTP
ncbi:caspase family protein [Spirosoma spitsbergense]|uniref:caspase family protein n=1 Tax=Spirosoma spitsbergense TaxID=431554 RepID=UPI00036D3394|nr:caspase family protein [Spirosoma spitsbergense]